MNTTISPLHEQSRTVPLTQFEPDELFFSITDSRGVIEHANSVFTRLSGYTFDEMKTQPHNIVRDPAMPKGAFKLIWDEMRAGRPVGSYVANRTRTGERYEVFAVMVPTDEGYISMRLRPEPGGMRDTIFEIFDRARAVEAKTEGGSNQQAEAGAAFLLAEFQAIGIASMEEFTRRTLPREVIATIEGLPALEYSAGREPLEILPGKVRMVSKLVLNPLRSLETVDQASSQVFRSVIGDGSRSAALDQLAATLQEVTDALAWSGAEDTTGGGKDLAEACERALEQLRRAQSECNRAVKDSEKLRAEVEGLAQNIGVFALQNQMIGRFAIELLGGSIAEPPGHSMRLLHQGLATRFALVTDGITAVNRMAQSTPDVISRAGRQLEVVPRPLQHWCELAERMVAKQHAGVSPDAVERLRWVRAEIQKGFLWPTDLQGFAEELGRVNVQIDELPLQATITFIGMVTAEIE